MLFRSNAPLPSSFGLLTAGAPGWHDAVAAQLTDRSHALADRQPASSRSAPLHPCALRGGGAARDLHTPAFQTHHVVGHTSSQTNGLQAGLGDFELGHFVSFFHEPILPSAELMSTTAGVFFVDQRNVIPRVRPHGFGLRLLLLLCRNLLLSSFITAHSTFFYPSLMSGG